MSEEREVVVVEHRPGEDKPWHISLEGTGVFDTGRALLNHPKRDFETREEAEGVAEEIRNLIKSDAVEVRDGSSSDSVGQGAGVAAVGVGGAVGGAGASDSADTYTADTVDVPPIVSDDDIIVGDPLVEEPDVPLTPSTAATEPIPPEIPPEHVDDPVVDPAVDPVVDPVATGSAPGWEDESEPFVLPEEPVGESEGERESEVRRDSLM